MGKEKAQLEKAESVARGEASDMISLKDRVITKAKLSNNNSNLCFRKRQMESKADVATPVSKKTRVTGVKNCDGAWNPKTSKYFYSEVEHCTFSRKLAYH